MLPLEAYMKIFVQCIVGAGVGQQYKEGNAPSIWSPLLAEDRMRPNHWLVLGSAAPPRSTWMKK